ncbi:MAG: FAD-binding protein, partial [Methyloligellaceae bacterium]
IGGLGLTGLVMWAEIQLKPVAGPAIAQETTRFANLKEFFHISANAGKESEYTVAWIDSLASGRSFGRGLFMAGSHAARDTDTPAAAKELTFPFNPPVPLLNRATLRVFNAFYYRKQFERATRNIVPYEPFFYPLDRIRNWHRAYGPGGLMQHQCVVPMDVAERAVTELLERSARAGAGSFLTVLKEFGSVRSPGLMSFPRPGLTLTLDFANRGERTLALLDRLDEVVIDAGGAVNPSKDGRMSARAFQAFFPQWRELGVFIDPRISSSFWRRVTECD